MANSAKSMGELFEYLEDILDEFPELSDQPIFVSSDDEIFDAVVVGFDAHEGGLVLEYKEEA